MTRCYDCRRTIDDSFEFCPYCGQARNRVLERQLFETTDPTLSLRDARGIPKVVSQDFEGYESVGSPMTYYQLDPSKVPWPD